MLLDILRNPVASIPYAGLIALRQQSRAPFLLETAEPDFGWQQYAHAGHCECTPKSDPVVEAVYTWAQTNDQPYRTVANGPRLIDPSWPTIRHLAVSVVFGRSSPFVVSSV